MGLVSRIGTYIGPFQCFGPNWDQVPNLGHHYEHCSCYLDFFFSETKFSETETFFRDQFFSKPKPRLFFRNQIFRNRNRNPQRFGKSFETEKFRNRNVNLCPPIPLSFFGHNDFPLRRGGVPPDSVKEKNR